MKLTDLETSAMLEEFKQNYFEPIAKIHTKYMQFKELPEKEAAKADDIAKKYHFLNSLCASVEATLEQNLVLKVEIKRLREKIIQNDKLAEGHVNNLVKQITK